MCDDEDRFNLSSEAYLEKHHILFYLEDCINQLLQYRDDNPKVNTVKFINEYFYSLKCGTHVLFRDFKFINATPHNRISFIKTFWQFFKNIGKKGDLLTVQEYHSLITLICSDLPFDLVQKTARIILLDDALDSLISFVDFLYAFQVQFYYQEFIQKCGEIYSVLHCQRSPRDPVVVPTSDIANLHTVSSSTSPPADGVEANSFLRAIMHLKDKKKISVFFSIPPVQVLKEILTSTSTSNVSFYEFLMALSRNEMLNTILGVAKKIKDQQTTLYQDHHKEVYQANPKCLTQKRRKAFFTLWSAITAKSADILALYKKTQDSEIQCKTKGFYVFCSLEEILVCAYTIGLYG